MEVGVGGREREKKKKKKKKGKEGGAGGRGGRGRGKKERNEGRKGTRKKEEPSNLFFLSLPLPCRCILTELPSQRMIYFYILLACYFATINFHIEMCENFLAEFLEYS